MSKWMNYCGSAAVVTALSGTVAWADVNAQQVWGDWKKYMSDFGYNVTAQEATSGDTLTVSNVTMNITLPEGEGTAKVTMGQMSFTSNADGTVSVGLPATMPLVVDVTPKYGKPVQIKMNYNNADFMMKVSGDANNMTYDYSARSSGVTLASIVAEGQSVNLGKIEITLNGMSGQSVMKIGNLREVSQTMRVDALNYNVDVANPENKGEFLKLKGGLNGMNFSGKTMVPLGGMNPEDMVAMLKAGFAVAGVFSHNGGSANFEFVDGRDNVKFASSSTSGSVGVTLNQSKIMYDVKGMGTTIDMKVPDLPFPIAAKMAQTEFKIDMPIAKSDASQAFQLAVTLGGLEVSDMIWGMIDPGKQLPRDAATLSFDLTGTGKLDFDLMDEKQQMAVQRGRMKPGEIHSAKLSNLLLQVAGAKLTGNADFTFDNSGPIPMPAGKATADLSGANALMDKLTAMGLLPQNAAMQARGMMGMFAKPGNGPDTLTSTFEMNKQGHIMVNGMRMR